MNIAFIGRESEQRILTEALNSPEAEMVAIVGRRRVGKTFLVRHTYEKRIVFSLSGELGAPREEHWVKWAYALKEYSGATLPVATPRSWFDAFTMLIDYLKTLDLSEKKVVFLDELSWLAAQDQSFMRGLSFFWNDWAVQHNIVVVICGSAASWMIQNVVNHTGGLHNRITRQINVKPFTLSETKQFLMSRGCHFSHYEISELYMALGGVPHYLKELRSDRSATQNIDLLCFAENGFLKTEFSNLYFALFENAEKHIAIIRALATSKQGMTRPDIIKSAKIAENGNTSRVLEELEQSGFIGAYFPFGKLKKDKLFRLTDEYSLFYLQFIEDKQHDGSGTWQYLSQTPAYKTWSGYAFESLCLKHIPQIKKALGISGVYSTASSFYQKSKADQDGAQIDLLIDRNDKVINVIEIKYDNNVLSLTKEQAASLRRKLQVFEAATGNRKRLMPVMISTFGLKSNEHSSGLIEAVITLDNLFDVMM